MISSRLFGQLWIRITAATSAVLLAILGVVVFAVYELTLTSERNELDMLLANEGKVIATEIETNVRKRAISGSPGQISEEDLRSVISRALALHPGSALHLAAVRWNDEILVSSRGPDRLAKFAESGELPLLLVDRIELVDGIRTWSTSLALSNSDVILNTMGDDTAITDGALDVASRTLIASALGAVVGLAALAITSHRSTRLISSVSSTVRNTRLDDLSQRVDVASGRDEISVLAQDVNQMLDDLTESRATRNRLIAAVSHELRTPLAAARGHTDLLREGRTPDPSTTIARIDRELLRITRLVDDLLALSRAADPSWLSIQLVSVQSVWEDLRARLLALGAPHATFGPAPDVLLEADPDRLLQALSNLAANAAIHTPAGTTIRFEAQVVESDIAFSVIDNGPGMPQSVLENFGEAFVRGSVTGTGLGLAVTRAVTIAHRGTLEVSSSPVGTTVTIRLPIEQSN